MNSVGSRKKRLPLIERSCPKLLTVNALAVAAILAGTAPVQAQNAASQQSGAASSSSATAAKKPAAAKSAATATKEGATAGKPAAGDTKSAGSYSLGVSMGEQLHRAGLTNDSVAVDRVAQGMKDALAGKAKLGPADQENIGKLVQTVRESLGQTNHAAAATFLAENGKKKDVVTTPSGLQYKVITAGSGESPKPTDQVTVNYRGTLLDGTEFDSSYKRGQPATFPVNGVIPGWQEALVLMKPGAHWQLFIPPKLAYDLESPPAIPPGSALVFDVELLNVKPGQAGAAQPQPTPPSQPQK
jgi:FKBP-type peptidyl-prolyl cis-trans isomerase FklB